MKARIRGTSAGVAVRMIVAIFFIVGCDPDHTRGRADPLPWNENTMGRFQSGIRDGGPMRPRPGSIVRSKRHGSNAGTRRASYILPCTLVLDRRLDLTWVLPTGSVPERFFRAAVQAEDQRSNDLRL